MGLNYRRRFFKKLSLSLASISFALSGFPSSLIGKKRSFNKKLPETEFDDDFGDVNDRVWIGEKYWAIPMEDWRVKDERLEFVGVEKFSRVNLLTTVINEGNGEMVVAVELGLMQGEIGPKKNGSAGFSIGIKDDLDPDVKSACYFGTGINAGVSTKGFLFIEDQSTPLPENFDFSAFTLKINGKRENHSTHLTLSCQSKDGNVTEVTYQRDKDIPGLVALVNNLEQKEGRPFWFRNIKISGSKIGRRPKNSFGPILWAMYTLSKETVRIAAQMPPLGVDDNKDLELYFKKKGGWQKVLTQKIDDSACVAHFQIDNWNSEIEVPYQLIYNNQGTRYSYNGTIRKEPGGRPLKFGGLTCQHANGYPYGPLVRNLMKHDPDLLYFSGDQLYEGNGGYPIKRQPEQDAILSYLGKWYMFGWAFGHIMRDRPTICTPDDHDVFQGNLWGEGGKKISFDEWEKSKKDAHGGYVQTPKMVNVVAQTQCGHMPAPYHPDPLKSGIRTWYTDVLYGRVSFAVISDRMFKSGPDRIRGGEGRIDHIKEPLSENELESPHLKLLGDPQMEFLGHWINDWKGAEMKVLLSQTIFSNPATHHGNTKMFLHGDMDSGGWPKRKRDDVLRLIRKGFSFHINGDQHLPFLVQYSLDEGRDAGWSFCTPAISTGYPRWGQPDKLNLPYTDRPSHGLPNTGSYKDVFGNIHYIYAVGNPEDEFSKDNRYKQAQSKSSGFGLITFNTQERTIKMEAFRFLADKDKPTAYDQFPGWPLTISQTDNDGRIPLASLPLLEIDRPGQVVKIIDEENKELINVLRVKGSSYQPKVYKNGTYTMLVGEGQNVKEINGISSTGKKSEKVIKVKI
ncbi:MAG: alkaline phosphatase D family protein [Cyclobacteriaceae bacterium]